MDVIVTCEKLTFRTISLSLFNKKRMFMPSSSLPLFKIRKGKNETSDVIAEEAMQQSKAVGENIAIKEQ